MDNFDMSYDSNETDSDGEIGIEITDCKSGKTITRTYTVPTRKMHYGPNEKRLICFSVIKNQACNYGEQCTYAHSLYEQKIDDDKKFIYQIIFDKNLMNICSITNPKIEEIYRNLLFMTNICNDCKNMTCTGGFNCRNGVCHESIKICKNDLLTGECLNKTIELQCSDDIIDKFRNDEFERCTNYKGCINGHHLTTRNLVPYYKYIHQKENSRKYKYQSVRYIDINPIYRLLQNDNGRYNNACSYVYNQISDESESSTDDEVNNWFSHRLYESSDDDGNKLDNKDEIDDNDDDLI